MRYEQIDKTCGAFYVPHAHSSFLIKKASDENTLIGGALARYHSGLSLTIRR